MEILWENIVLQYGIIARAQRLMFVRDQNDLTKVLKREKESSGLHSDSWEKEYQLQFAWDKHATLLKAQSVAMKTLDGLLARYDELLRSEKTTEEQQLRIDKLRSEIAKLKGEDGDPEADGGENFVEALKGKVPEVWDNGS
ncbi:some similarities to phage-related terminase small subunit homolog yqaS [Sporomusa ovata]|uniref:Some similarities to phage-related terminase small subunit homolog yqaS n=1 Tax=Sporomusa ovata TaxID=2378 RepID=A0A0U1L5H1_9FIRM|nr:some similarities to phage-related terminase small subunit homolog yqaS [Sporomusa ovata]